MKNRKKIFIQAKLMPGQKNKFIYLYVVNSENLVLELTEKQAQRYLMMSNNDFGCMIEDLIIVTNSKLKIEAMSSKFYTNDDRQRQKYFSFVVDQMQDKIK